MEFWRPDRWLPRDVPWSNIPPKFTDLLYPIYFAVPLLIIRILYESFVGVPLGHLLGYYGKTPLCRNIFSHLLGGFAVNTKSKRVLECFWRFSYYVFAFSYGIMVMLNKSWLWDVKQCWIGYPYHQVDDAIWWYYMVEMSFYYSLLLASIFDVKRSDFWELIIHHVVTVGLLAASWTINFVRVGTLVLLSHDVADILLEGGKLTRYDRNLKMATNVIFVFFLLSWIVTRLVYYPMVVIRSAVFEAANLIQPDYDLYDFTQVPYVPRFIILLLCILLVLHVFWTVLIVRVVIKTVTQGAAGDVRSDSDSDAVNTTEVQRKKLLTKHAQKQQEDEDSDSNLTKPVRRRKARRE